MKPDTVNVGPRWRAASETRRETDSALSTRILGIPATGPASSAGMSVHEAQLFKFTARYLPYSERRQLDCNIYIYKANGKRDPVLDAYNKDKDH